jgi:hypothetical protein
MVPSKEKQQRDLLRLLGVDTRRLSKADVAEGAEAARRISQCERVPGANKRRSAAIDAWHKFLQRTGQGVNVARRFDRLKQE